MNFIDYEVFQGELYALFRSFWKYIPKIVWPFLATAGMNGLTH